MDNKCNECDREFNSPEGLEQHNQAKHGAKPNTPFFNAKNKKQIKLGVYAVVALLIIGGLAYFFMSSIEILPPTDMKGHIESWPSNKINKKPIATAQFKHILEHSETPDERPGVIISYNCKGYECPSDLIQNLESFAEEFEHVYVAPYPRMTTMIALTRLRRQKTLEVYDAGIIRAFVQ